MTTEAQRRKEFEVERDENGVAHIVGLSGGKDSTCLAVWLAENEPRPYTYVCTPTQDELPEMVEHWQNLERLLGKPLLMLKNEGLVPLNRFLMERQIRIPERTDCARCPMQMLGEWYNLWLNHPKIYADAEAEEVAHGHTYRSPSRDTWPASLAELRQRFEAGDIPQRSLNMMEKRNGMCRVCAM